MEVPAAGLVPGDLVLLEAGDRVAADMMVMSAANLEVENRHLLGNDGVALPPLHDQRMLRAGTEILRGHAEAVVLATGSRTELGRIAHTLGQLERRPSAVQRRITRLAHVLLKVAGAVLGIVTGVGLLRGMPALELLQRWGPTPWDLFCPHVRSHAVAHPLKLRLGDDILQALASPGQ